MKLICVLLCQSWLICSANHNVVDLYVVALVIGQVLAQTSRVALYVVAVIIGNVLAQTHRGVDLYFVAVSGNVLPAQTTVELICIM